MAITEKGQIVFGAQPITESGQIVFGKLLTETGDLVFGMVNVGWVSRVGGRAGFLARGPLTGTNLTLGQATWTGTGAGVGLDSKTHLTLGQGSWVDTGSGLSMNAKTQLTLGAAFWYWTGLGIRGVGSAIVNLRQLMGVGN